LRRRGRGVPSTQKSVDNRAGREQLRTGGEPWRLSLQFIGRRLLWRVQIGPIGRDQRARAVGYHEQQIESTAPVTPAENLERLSLMGMPRTKDGYALRITIEVVVVGIMACLPLTELTTIGS
jgi:hypothetical protein